MGFPNLAYAAEEGENELSNAVIWTEVILFLFFAYGNNIVRLFAAPPDSSIVTWIEKSLRRMLGLEPRPSAASLSHNESSQPFRSCGWISPKALVAENILVYLHGLFLVANCVDDIRQRIRHYPSLHAKKSNDESEEPDASKRMTMAPDSSEAEENHL
ncbi:hypothetical protein G7Y89_g11055 [Cudoniella acicularis]|uniref:Uncharacterized protein n=1 Tax=Cudoniella acicularis TaxID=354080 RepID=A0A8H4RDX0_9HELO|nr:hypothetical protein G7Y89_g11055 [Cudoniella acicularis]